MEVDSLRRRVTLALSAYAIVFLLLAAAVLGGVTATEPVVAMPSAGGGVPLPAPVLRSVLGEGFPTLGLARPAGGLTRVLPPGRALAWAVDALTGLRPGDPTSVLSDGLPALATVPPPAAARGRWPWQTAPAPAASAGRPGDVVLWGTRPVVLIYSTNTRDSFWPVIGGKPSAERPLPLSDDPAKNMLAVGRALGQALWQNRVPTMLATAVNDRQGVIGAYLNSAAVVRRLMAAYPSLAVFVDLDRATSHLGAKDGAARIVIVVGTDARLPNPRWHENLAFAKRLGAELQTIAPGLLLGIYPSPDRLNQELSTRALTVEVGGPDNTLAEEAKAAAILAEALASLRTAGAFGD